MTGRPILYMLPASHPCFAVMRGFELKGLAYERVDLLPLVHVVHQRLAFGRRTVPGLVLPDGDRVVGSRAILRVLEGLEPEPPLLPADRALRGRVEAAEAWGDEVLQPIGRRVIWPAIQLRPDAIASYIEGADLPLPASLAVRSAGLVSRLERQLNRATDAAARADLAALPDHLDRVDGWIADGILGGDAVSVADLQIGSTLRLLLTIGDVAPLIAGRPAEALARRVFPAYPGAIPAGTLPADWLPAQVAA